MPGGVSMAEALGQPQVNTDADFSMAIIGFSSSSAVDPGELSPAYNVPAAAASDLAAGDAVDALLQAITKTEGNPAPPPASFYSTPATTPGSYGTINTSGVNGTATPTNHTAVTPLGTYQPWMKIVKGGVLGTDSLTAYASLNNGEDTKLVSLGTALNYDFPATDGWGVDNRAGFTLGSASDTLNAGDTFYTNTFPPMFDEDDLFDSSDPDAIVGAFAAIAESSQLFGVIVITEPIVDADYDGSGSTGNVFSTLVAGLNYGLSFGKRWHLITRFRDPMAGETDADYILAWQAFKAAHHDNRIECLPGSIRVTDAFTGHTYLRNGIAPYLARLQSFQAVPGERGERLAQNPGWVGRGPIEGASLKNEAGVTIGHDEATRGGIEAVPSAPVGSGNPYYYQRNAAVAGTYMTNRVTVLYDVLSTILTPMDRRVANALETAAVGVSLTSIGGADIFSDTAPHILDEDIRGGLQAKIAKVIRDNYANEFQNAQDPNLVVIDDVVTVSGAQVTITGTLHVRFYGYTDTVRLTFSATR